MYMFVQIVCAAAAPANVNAAVTPVAATSVFSPIIANLLHTVIGKQRADLDLLWKRRSLATKSHRYTNAYLARRPLAKSRSVSTNTTLEKGLQLQHDR
jgi:hypothetical protein